MQRDSKPCTNADGPGDRTGPLDEAAGSRAAGCESERSSPPSTLAIQVDLFIEALHVLKAARGICSCSNSHLGGFGAHEPLCVGLRATNTVSALERSLLR